MKHRHQPILIRIIHRIERGARAAVRCAAARKVRSIPTPLPNNIRFSTPNRIR